MRRRRDVVPQRGGVEVEQQTDREVKHTQVGQKLFGMHGCEAFDGLDFDDHLSGDEQIGPKGFVENPSGVGDGNRLLPDYPEAAPSEFVGEQDLVDMLQ